MLTSNKEKWSKLIVASFLSVPILASIISTLHIVHYLNLGNPDWMSYFLSVTFEVGSIASFVALSVLDKLKKGMVLFIFFILFLMQLMGNVYFSFEYINIKLLANPEWMGSFIELIRPIYDADDKSTYKFILAMIIGVPIPLVSLSFLKSLVDYLKVDEDARATTSITTQDVEVIAPIMEQPADVEIPKAEEAKEEPKSRDRLNNNGVAPFTNSHE